jgi:hypothetical protein
MLTPGAGVNEVMVNAAPVRTKKLTQGSAQPFAVDEHGMRHDSGCIAIRRRYAMLNK